jgi:hypothetical protein
LITAWMTCTSTSCLRWCSSTHFLYFLFYLNKKLMIIFKKFNFRHYQNFFNE